MLNALVSGVCCIITTYFLLEYPMFTSPKYRVEQKMGKQNWENFNSFQRRIKIQGQLEEIEKEKTRLLQETKLIGKKRRSKRTKRKKNKKKIKFIN